MILLITPGTSCLRRVAALSLLLAPLCAAAAVSRVEGIVSSSTNHAPIPGAAIAARCASQQVKTATNAAGEFLLQLPQDCPAWDVTVSLNGFEPWHTTVQADRDRRDLPVQLALPSHRDTVTVDTAVSLVSTTAPEISQTASRRQIENLPLRDRSLANIALLDPHVQTVFATAADAYYGQRLVFNNESFRYTAFQLDGSSNYEVIYANGPAQNIAQSAVQDVRILSNQYTSDFGSSSSGIVAVTSRSGANDLHGDAFLTLRPSGIQAAAPLSPSRSPNELWQYGASVGGPLVKERTFGFLNFEALRQQRGSYIQTVQPGFFDGQFRQYLFLGKVDQHWNDRHTATLKINGSHYATNNANDGVGALAQASTARQTVVQSGGVQIGETDSFGSLLSQFRFQYANYIPLLSQFVSDSVGISIPGYATAGGSGGQWTRGQIYDLGETLSIQLNRHLLKFGGSYTRQIGKDYSQTPLGTYTYAAGTTARMVNGQLIPDGSPTQYTQTFGAPLIHYGNTGVSGFLQDDFRWNPRVTLNLGLRYEYQSTTGDTNNLAPRAGLTWDLFGTGNTVLRAGAGLFYDPYYLYITRLALLNGLNAPVRTVTLAAGAAGFPDFPNSLASLPVGPSAALDLYLQPKQSLNPYNAQYSLGIQQSLGRNWFLSVDGIHSHTLKLMRPEDANAPSALVRTAPGQVRSVAAANATRPAAFLGDVPVRKMNLIENSNSSLYDALEIGVVRRFSSRAQFEAHYTYAYSMTYSMFQGEATTGLPNDFGNLGAAERGPSDYYQRHRLVVNGFLRLPCALQLSGVGRFASGRPVNPLTGVDNNGDTNLFDRPAGVGRDAYRVPANQVTADVALSRGFVFLERWNLDARFEVFNLFNKNNPFSVNGTYGNAANPGAAFLSPLAGVTNIDPSRQMQFTLKFSF